MSTKVERKSEIVTCMMTEEMREKARLAAKSFDPQISLSGYIRYLIEKDIEKRESVIKNG